jgi:hypothetical protein
MSLKNRELATISPSNRREGRYTVDVYSDDGHQFASFNCGSESSARALRDAIRDHADSLRYVQNARAGHTTP